MPPRQRKSPTKTQAKRKSPSQKEALTVNDVRELKAGLKKKTKAKKNAPDKEWEDEEIGVPLKPMLPQLPPEHPNDPDIDAPDPPPIRNESGETSLEEAPVIAPPRHATFEVAELLKDPELWQDGGKIQRLVVNLSVLGYLSNESIANSLLKIQDSIEALVQSNVLVAQAVTSAAEASMFRGGTNNGTQETH